MLKGNDLSRLIVGVVLSLFLFFLFGSSFLRNFFWARTKNILAITQAEQVTELLNREDQRELKILKRLAGRGGWHTLPAHLIARADPHRLLYFIDQGANQGVIAGSAVVSPEGFLVGKISQAWPEVATLLLLSDNTSRVSARLVEDPTRTPLVLAGERGLTMRLGLAGPELQARLGLLVVSGGQEVLIPTGLPIGEVAVVEPQDGEGLFQNIVVRSPVEGRTLQVVGVLIFELPTP